jgi:hypothetical protein
LLPAYSRTKLESLAPLKEPKPFSKEKDKSYTVRRKKIAEVLHLQHMYIPKIYRQETVKFPNGQRKVVSYLPQGQVIRETTLKPDRKDLDRWIYTRQNCGVKSINDKVSSLSFLVHVIASLGFNPKSHKTLKRIMLVGFTTHKRNLFKMVSKVARECGYRYDIVRNPSVFNKLPIPSFTGETKSTVSGDCVPLWCTKYLSKRKASPGVETW